MPYSLDYKDIYYDVDITSDVAITHNVEEFHQLTRFLIRINNIMPLDEFKLDRLGNQNKYNYVLKTKNGRTWTQEILYDPAVIDTDPPMSFTTDHFRLSEFATQRELRDTIVAMMNKFKCSKIVVKWT